VKKEKKPLEVLKWLLFLMKKLGVDRPKPLTPSFFP